MALPPDFAALLGAQHRTALASGRRLPPLAIGPEAATELHVSHLAAYNTVRVAHRTVFLDGGQFAVQVLVPVWYDRVPEAEVEETVRRVGAAVERVTDAFAEVETAGWRDVPGLEGRYCHFTVRTSAEWAAEAVERAKAVERWVANEAGLPAEGQADVDSLLTDALAPDETL